MTAPRPFPLYPKKPHKHSGGARIKIAGKIYYLGKHGSDKSYREYERLRLEHASKGVIAFPTAAGDTVNALVAAWLHADPRGKNHPEVERVVRACVPLCRMFGETQANEFRAVRLRALQDTMATQSWMTKEEKAKCGPWSRGYVNKNIQRVVSVFRWGESSERVPAGTTEHLKTVPMLKANDKRVKSLPPRAPVDWESQVQPCLPFLPPQVAAMVQVQYHAGLRPSEVCSMRRSEIERHEVHDVWLYRPGSHKNAHRGIGLVKVLGPQAQAAALPWLMAADPDGYVFPPMKRRYSACYHVEGYGRAIARACIAAKVKHWSAYQLRHACRLRVTREFSLDAARAVLGHSTVTMSAQYAAGVDIETASKVARKIG